MEATEVHQAPIAVDEPMNDAYAGTGEQEPMDITPKTEEEYAQSMLTLRAIVSSKEAGVIIGKAGKNVADLRDETGVKAGVSKVVPGVHDRVLTVTGPLQGTARAYAIVAKGLLEGAPQMGMGGVVSNNGTHRKSSHDPKNPRSKKAAPPRQQFHPSIHPGLFAGYRSELWPVPYIVHYPTPYPVHFPGRSTLPTYLCFPGFMGSTRRQLTCNANYPQAVRLLISHNQMGTIIGRQGGKIKEIQDASGVRMVAQKEMLPQSTERIVEVQGTPEGIEKAVWEIGKCLIDDWQRGTGTVLYNPAVRASVGGAQPGPQVANPTNPGNGYNNRQYNRTGNGADFSDNSGFNRRSNSDAGSRGFPLVTEDGDEIQTQNISIPADMVGCIIGRAGSKITEIRRSSGARISIAKAPHDETGERMFTIMGSASANEKALYLLYENLEAEKTRRSQLPQE
ncbi:RNA-binding protein rnc1 [Penicillium diatomitis]|uniref:RNA-binding protein rnc1 n=1 Tax=Penicillium diatomitis TaxID=2819901 RepID=A0A9W9XGK8_9EURO|nr:RNA-binding protein rnc1 [Penicillium diatomitis]KAJ5492617.1 RNA-binding protein rnc1 [Penicillium diatomitis]